MNNTQEYYTTNEVAELLRVEANTVRRYIKEGKIKAIKMPSGGLRIPREEISYLLEGVTK